MTWIVLPSQAELDKKRHRDILALAQQCAARQGESTSEWVERQRALVGWRIHPWIDGYLTQDFDRTPQ